MLHCHIAVDIKSSIPNHGLAALPRCFSIITIATSNIQLPHRCWVACSHKNNKNSSVWEKVQGIQFQKQKPTLEIRCNLALEVRLIQNSGPEWREKQPFAGNDSKWGSLWLGSGKSIVVWELSDTRSKRSRIDLFCYHNLLSRAQV